MQLYIGERKNKIEEYQLTQFLSICKFIINLKPSDLFDVTEKEFNQKCEDNINIYEFLF